MSRTSSKGGGDNGRLGLSMLAAPDWDGDGVGGLILGAPLSPDALGIPVGRVFVLQGLIDSDRDLSTAGAVLVGPDDSTNFGASVATADLDGDGVEDLVVGAHLDRDRAGGAYVFAGPVVGEVPASAAMASIAPAPTDGFLGRRMVGLGDRDGDGYGELLISAHRESPANSGPARVYYFTGPLLGTIAAGAASAVVQAPAGSDFGASLSVGCDATGDGAEDLLIGSPGSEFAGLGSGSVFAVTVADLTGG
jgi:hypothetical protein